VNDQWEGQSSFIAKLKDDSPQWTRFEQNSSKIQYTGTWYSNNMSVHSGGTATLALDRGARATFTFTGTMARWIAYRDQWSGIANVYLDGMLQGSVDTYAVNGTAQAVMYATPALTSGSHTLAIEVSGTRNSSALSSWIWLDAFDAVVSTDSGSGSGGTGGSGGSGGSGGGTLTFRRVEQNNSAVTYTGTWYGNSMSLHSGGSAVLALDKGARATFAFNGTAAKWIGYQDPWSGIANVYVDGVLKTQVDSYSASGQGQQVLYSITGLGSGSHTLVVEVTGTKNASARSAWIWVDAFESASDTTTGGSGGGSTGGGTTGTFTRVEQNGSMVAYTGTWYGNNMSVHSGGSATLALGAGARTTFTFTGTAVKWIGYKDPWSGIANVYVDGVLKTQVDSYSASGQAQQALYTITGLSSGSHTLVIEVTGTKNASAQSAWIWVDAFDYMS